MKTKEVYERHTENCCSRGIGYELEQLEQQIIDETLEDITLPENLSKISAEIWLGDACLDALAKRSKIDFVVPVEYLETLTVCITLN